MATILDTIVESKRREIDAAQSRIGERELNRLVESAPATRDFEAALRRPGMRIIAEIKKASPSAGVIRHDFDPVGIARSYEANGADCLSVLTDGPFFQGDLAHMRAARTATRLPVLRKDFILDRYQLLEARAHGADAALLIAEILPGDMLSTMFDAARSLGLHVLVELHDPEHLPRVIDSGATMIGINNRDLRTFETRLEHTLKLVDRVPPDRVVVSESGIRSHADLVRLTSAGVKAVLVGESLMRGEDVGRQLHALRTGAGA